LQRPSGYSTASTRVQALSMLNKVLEGYRFHPFFFILNVNLNTNADPPVLPFAHQAELLFRLVFRRPVRILVGDEIGLGKTIEAILIVRFLEGRDKVRRILLLVPRILVDQWKSELKRFGIHPTVIERKNIQTLYKQGFPEGWYISSIDLVKRGEHKQKILSADWDVVVVDEAHRVGKTRSGQKSITQRYELVEELAKVPTRSIILLSATPHRGDALDYISRLKLLDPYLVAEKELDSDSFYKLTRNSIVIRRTKMDVNEVYERREVFKKARFVARVIGATQEEAEFNELLLSFLRDKLLKYYGYIGEEPKALPLLLALIAKRASSSPRAAMVTLERILRKRSLVVRGEVSSLADADKLDEEAESIAEAYLGLGFEDYDEVSGFDVAKDPDDFMNSFVENIRVLLEKEDFDKIERLFELARRIAMGSDSRLKGVLEIVREHINKGDKVVVFTEYRDTAEYIYERLKKEMPEIADAVALITSDRILIPGLSKNSPTIEDLKRSLRRGLVKVIVSTDVASEGLNLQVANVIVNYEPTWSPVKVEQRLGRVWRLGQEKDVTSYTVFLALRSDKDVLDVLYKKLLAWGRSLQESKLIIGEEVIIDMMSEEGPITVPLDAAKGTPKYSEYKALIRYIRGGRSELERYIQSILSALEALRKNLERVSLARRNITLKIEKLLSDTLGDFRGEDVERLLRDLFIVVAQIKGYNVKVSGDRVFAGTYRLENVYDYYSSALSILQEAGVLGGPVYLVSSAQLGGLKELHLFKVVVSFKDKPVYSETVGIGVKGNSTEILRGRRLLEVVVKALAPDKVIGVQEYYIDDKLVKVFRAIARGSVLGVARAAVKEFLEYTSETEKQSFSSHHADWEPKSLSVYNTRSPEYIGAIIFTTPPEAGNRVAVPPFKVEEVERAAMKIAMEYERKSGRRPEDVSKREHFDILSSDPYTGEIRYIEVKGKSGLDLEIELTETEFRVAREKGERYWLYIVYGISTGKPRLLAVRDPINNMKWERVDIPRYRFRPE